MLHLTGADGACRRGRPSLVVLALRGLLDWVTWGVPFYSFWQNFSVNVLADKAASFGTLPVYWYLMYYANAWPGLVAVMLGLLAVGGAAVAAAPGRAARHPRLPFLHRPQGIPLPLSRPALRHDPGQRRGGRTPCAGDAARSTRFRPALVVRGSGPWMVHHLGLARRPGRLSSLFHEARPDRALTPMSASA